jgi:hypothetical protein
MSKLPRRLDRSSSEPASSRSLKVSVEDPLATPLGPSATSHHAEVGRLVVEEGITPPQRVERGGVVFDLDGTVLDDIGLISHVAADVMNRAFGTPP